ncbi:MAG: hypothetical protein J0H41_17220 [Rhizobiales bacterium]|nr:hypothetical protein [Hyphomicrobiales bacterium]
MADEYDAAQELEEVVGAHDGAKKRVPDRNAIATAEDIGVTRKDIHNARAVRDVEAADPSIVRRVFDGRPAAGVGPAKAS